MTHDLQYVTVFALSSLILSVCSSSTDVDITQANGFSVSEWSGTEPRATRVETLSAPKRSDSNLHVALNGLFGFSKSHNPGDRQDRMQTFQHLNDHRNNRKSKHSSDIDSDARSSVFTHGDVVSEGQSPQLQRDSTAAVSEQTKKE
jgi:hypothetical protein